MKSNTHRSFHHQAGFSLVEIMVGLVIGLLATLVILQVFSVFEGQKRTTSGASDTQTNGSIALYNIAKELQMAGYGLPPIPSPMLQKTVSAFKCTALTPSAIVTDITPVTITDGGAGAGASDSITIRYGTSPQGAVPSLILSSAGNDITVDNNMSCRIGDVAMVVSATGSSCAFTRVTGPTDIDPINPVPTTPAPNFTTVSVQDNVGAIGAVTNAMLSCIGNWNVSTFRVNPAYDPAVAANSQAYLEQNNNASVADIVNIQAQYGISLGPRDNKISQWVDPVNAPWNDPKSSVTDRNRIKAIHIAVVARSGLFEKDIVTYPCTTNQGTVNNGPCAWDDTNLDAAPKIDLSNDPNWQHYRYRVFDSIIPLRNMIWSWSSL